VRDDIVRWLGLRDPAVVARGFDRPELFLAVEHFADGRQKQASLVRWVEDADRPGIVYAATRRAASEVAAALVDQGVQAATYHAGLGDRQRSEVLDRFMADDLEVVVATVAFGLGVDKANVRFVAHHDPSDSIEAYHQEIGRGGRDGESAQARLFFDPADLALRRFQTVPPPLPEPEVRRIVRRLGDGPTTSEILAHQVRLSRRRAEQIVGRLEDLGQVRVEPTGEIWTDPSLPEQPVNAVVAEVVDEQERRRRHARSRVELLRGYAETEGCRRRFLLNALGEEYEAPCGNCDRCLAAEEAVASGAGRTPAEVDRAIDEVPFRLGDPVVHGTFGRGEVARVEGDRVIVRFEKVGYRTLALEAIREHGLLTRARAEP
jgi:ATP-dependent DNA helicase RecQ